MSLLGALGGVGEAGMDIANQNRKTWAQEDSDARSLDSGKQLAQMQSDLAFEKQKRIEELKRSDAQDDRNRIGGIVSSARSITGDEKAKTDATRKSLLESGELDAYKTVSDANSKDEVNDVKRILGEQNLALRSAYNDSRSAINEYRMKLGQVAEANQETKADKERAHQLSALFGKEGDMLTGQMKDPRYTDDPQFKSNVDKQMDAYKNKASSVMLLSEETGASVAKSFAMAEAIKSGQAKVMRDPSGDGYAVDIGGGKGVAISEDALRMMGVSVKNPASAKPAPAGAASKKMDDPIIAKKRAESSDLDQNKRYVKNKLMGMFDGPDKYKEIARTNTNPDLRKAAQELWDEYEKSLRGSDENSDQPQL